MDFVRFFVTGWYKYRWYIITLLAVYTAYILYQVYSGHSLGSEFFESTSTTCKFLKPIVNLMAKHPYITLKGLNPGWNSGMDSVP